MLGSLLKHEFKAINKLLIPLHLGLILLTIVGRLAVQPMVTDSMFSSADTLTGILMTITIAFYVFILCGVAATTYIYLYILRPKAHWFGDEGYLTHTLPVSTNTHIWCGIITTSIWTIVSGLCTALSIFLIFVNEEFSIFLEFDYSEILLAIADSFGVHVSLVFPLLLTQGTVSMIGGILFYYACLAIGHSFNSHKMAFSILIYIGLNFTMSILSLVCNFGLNGFSLFATNNASLSITYWITTTLIAIVQASIYYGATWYFLDRRLNLE